MIGGMQVAAGAASVTTYFSLRKTSDGTPATGLTIADIDLQYTRSGALPTAKVDAVALAATDSAFAANKAIEIDATDQPGLFRIDWPDAAFLVGTREVLLTVKEATVFAEHLRVELDGSATAISNAVWDAILSGSFHNIPASAGRRLRQLAEFGTYSNGRIYLDTLDGATGTTDFEHGTDSNAVKTMPEANTIATSRNIHDFHIFNGSIVVLGQSAENQSFFGDHWTMDLNGKACGGLYCQGATVSGAGTSTGEEMKFEVCDVLIASVQRGHFDKCGFSGTLTMTKTADYDYHNCYSKGDTAPVFTKTAGQTITAEFQNYAGDITVTGLQTNDTIELGGFYRTVMVDGTGGIVHLHGHYETVTDLSGGTVTILVTGAIKTADVAAIKVKTDSMTFTKVNELDSNIKSINDAEVVGDGDGTPWDGV